MTYQGVVHRVSSRDRSFSVHCSDGSYAVFRALGELPAVGHLLQWERNTALNVLRHPMRTGGIDVDGALYYLPAPVAAVLVD